MTATGGRFQRGHDPRRGKGRPFQRGYDPRRHLLSREERARGGWVAFIRFARRYREELNLPIPPLWESV